MGYFDIPLKPSTILVFSIAFGISVDNAIQFMAKYRLDLIQNNGKIKAHVKKL
jgi:predicted RND superfamily exporter protein